MLTGKGSSYISAGAVLERDRISGYSKGRIFEGYFGYIRFLLIDHLF
jgi:hypothetical protein